MNYPKQKIAEDLASHGRYGDSRLVHVNEAELQGLNSLMPGGLTTNPETGQPEAFAFLLPLLASGIGTAAGMGVLGTAALSGAMTAAVTGDLKRGIASAIMGAGIGSALKGASGVAEGVASEASALTSLAETGLPAESIMPGIGDIGSSFAEEATLQNLVQPGAIGVEGTGIGLTAQSTLSSPPPLSGFGERLAAPFKSGNLMEEVMQAKNMLPIAIGGGQLEAFEQQEYWDKQAAELAQGREEDKKKYYEDLQRGYAAAQPFAMRGASPYRSQMSRNTPPPWQPAGFAEGGIVSLQHGGRAPAYYDYEDLYNRVSSPVSSAGPPRPITGFPVGGGGSPSGASGQFIDPVTIQRNLRGQAVAPPPGFMPGFNPEMSYFQNLEEGQAPQYPQFSAPFQNNLYAGSPINSFMQNSNQPYFENILPPPPLPPEVPKKGETKIPNVRPPGYAEGGDVQLDSSLGPMSVAAGGIANIPNKQDITVLTMAVNGQLEEQQVDMVINMFIQKYGVEAFRAAREQILGAAQTEGMVQGAGDGMADQVYGSIGNQQDIAVSPGEFIVPSDVVSGLGNGSSDAGAQQLDQMMGNVRQARQGGRTQPPPIDPRQMLPA